MRTVHRLVPACLGLSALALATLRPLRAVAEGGAPVPERVIVHSGPASLHALLWRPEGRGPFPAVLLVHGSGRTAEELARLGPYEPQAHVLGPVFARHGYAFLYPFRRGVGPSADQGTSAVDLMTEAAASRGAAARNAVQMQLLEGRELGDARAALAFLRARRDVDARRIAVVGHSFGGSLALILAEGEPDLRAVVVFSAAGYSWDRSPELRARLLAATARTAAPIFLIHAANDFTVSSGRALDAHRAELGKRHRLEIYPPVGRTVEDGHGILYTAVPRWERDVFAFLDEHVAR
jgi:dienelactone hydrolase